MKKMLNIILILILTFSSLKANAKVMSDSEIKSIIAKQVEQNYKSYTNAQLEIEVVALPFKNLNLPDGKTTFKVESSMNKFQPRELEKVSVYVNDQFIRTFNAPIVVKAWEEVLVASYFINREQQITTQNTTVKKIEISNILEYPLRAEALKKSMLAKKTFNEGEIIDKRFVKLKPDILRNSTVTILFKASDLTVSFEATALSDGIIGDNICLVNRNYNKVYTGKVIGENKVLIEI